MTDPTQARHPPSVTLGAAMTLSMQPFGAAAVVARPGEEPQVRPVPTGQRQTVAELYDEHFEFLYRAFYRMGVSRGQIDDAIQDLFMVVFRRYEEFEQRSTVRSWLYGIALRVAKAYRRKAAPRRDDILLDEGEHAVDTINPQEERERLEAAEIVQAILETMDEPFRVVFTMTELEEFTAPEIAVVLGISVNTVYSRLRLARAEFERAVERNLARQRRRP